MEKPAVSEEAKQLLEIYEWYVKNTAITFETDAPSPEEFQERMRRPFFMGFPLNAVSVVTEKKEAVRAIRKILMWMKRERYFRTMFGCVKD